MRKSKMWYEDAHKGDEAMKKYYTGVYAERNDMLFKMIFKEIKSKQIRILDIAAGSSYMAELFLKLNNVISYSFNDFNDKVIKFVLTRINDNRFNICSFDAEDDIKHYNDNDLMICLSLEHIENDFGLLNAFNKDTLCALCSPNFDARSHVRYFDELEDFKKRYENHLNIIEANELVWRHKKTKRVLKKYMILGYKK
jgi:hypothetical protein